MVQVNKMRLALHLIAQNRTAFNLPYLTSTIFFVLD